MTTQPLALSAARQRRDRARFDAALWAIAQPPEEEILAYIELTARIALEPNLDTLWNRFAAYGDNPHAQRIRRIITVVRDWRAQQPQQPCPTLQVVSSAPAL
jgi:hypothetical protein